ncbi:MAG: hypothetical protein GX941_07585 [Candidatus Methanofastidiosa archaeon]|nr:hypothetical protein [Candidatus Methanofastidiosa archaeon]HOM95989.1 hypothetical protein [Methanofastidiosum sp.]HPC81095.1 hypothetical protein [Methanofastidiosum sp.]HRS25611.1 hypothetical protein [Methanofastidiosum sp.]
MANEFDQAYEFVIKSCNYLGSICSLKDEIEVWEKKEEDMIFIIDKNSERFLSRKKEDDPDWYENSRSMLNSLIDSNFSLSLCLY